MLPLQVLSISGGLTFLTTVNITVLRATNQRLAFSILMLITLGVNLALNILLIPRYRHVGSAFSMLASEGVLLVLSTTFISRSISKLEYIGFTWKAIIVSVLMGLGLYFTPFVLVWIRIIGAIGMYFSIMWFWGELRHFSTTRSLVKSQK